MMESGESKHASQRVFNIVVSVHSDMDSKFLLRWTLKHPKSTLWQKKGAVDTPASHMTHLPCLGARSLSPGFVATSSRKAKSPIVLKRCTSPRPRWMYRDCEWTLLGCARPPVPGARFEPGRIEQVPGLEFDKWIQMATPTTSHDHNGKPCIITDGIVLQLQSLCTFIEGLAQKQIRTCDILWYCNRYNMICVSGESEKLKLPFQVVDIWSNCGSLFLWILRLVCLTPTLLLLLKIHLAFLFCASVCCFSFQAVASHFHRTWNFTCSVVPAVSHPLSRLGWWWYQACQSTPSQAHACQIPRRPECKSNSAKIANANMRRSIDDWDFLNSCSGFSPTNRTKYTVLELLCSRLISLESFFPSHVLIACTLQSNPSPRFEVISTSKVFSVKPLPNDSMWFCTSSGRSLATISLDGNGHRAHSNSPRPSRNRWKNWYWSQKPQKSMLVHLFVYFLIYLYHMILHIQLILVQ